MKQKVRNRNTGTDSKFDILMDRSNPRPNHSWAAIFPNHSCIHRDKPLLKRGSIRCSIAAHGETTPLRTDQEHGRFARLYAP